MTALVRPITYDAFRREAQSGDILVCRAASPEGRLIVHVTHDEHSHASLVGWINEAYRDDPGSSALMIVESVQHQRTRIVPLSGEIERYSGYYDVFRPKDIYPRLFGHLYDGRSAFAWACRGAGSKYGWWDLFRVLCRRYLPWPFNRLPPVPDSQDPLAKRDCACRVHAAIRSFGGPRVKLFDCEAVPGDFTDPKLFDYVGTLYWSPDEVHQVNQTLDAYRVLEAATLDAAENGWDEDEDEDEEGDDAA